MAGKITKEQQTMIVAVLLFFGGLYVYWNYLLSPTLQEISTKEAQYADLSAKIEQAELQARRLPALKAEKEKLEIELVALEKQLPKDQDTPNIIRALTREAMQENLEFERLTPKPLEAREYFQVIPFELQFAGSLQSLARFLASLGQQERIFQAQNLKLSPKGGTENDGGMVNLTISLTIMTYAYLGAS
jgi:Tfp pilus assembly protein PilO